MATLKDVARLANVSPSTVSYVLNNKKQVKAETYARIQEAVKELNYYPNMTARGLKTKKSNTIGVIVPDISNLFFIDVLHGIEEMANDMGYSIILCNTENDATREKKYLEILLAKDIDGLVFIGTGSAANKLSTESIKIPIVIVDRKIGEKYTSVCLNNVKGGYLAGKHLIEKGCRNIALLSGPLSISTILDRVIGYKSALEEAGIQYNDEFIVETRLSYNGGYEAAKKLIEKDIQFDAIFAPNDLIAIGAMRTLYEQGIKVPQDVSIVGFDDIKIAEIFIPSITTIRQPKFEMGKKAAELVINIIDERTNENQIVEFDPELIIRETT